LTLWFAEPKAPISIDNAIIEPNLYGGQRGTASNMIKMFDLIA